MDNFLYSTLHSNSVEFEYNVECKKLSILPLSRGETLKNLEKELKKNKYLSFTFPLWKENYK